MKRPDTTVKIGGITMKNPVMTASGTFGYGPEYADVIDLNRLGAVVVKGISAVPCAGNALPRTFETTGGMLNAIGLQNPGAAEFVRGYLPFLRQYDVPVIVNVWGRTVEEYERVVAELEGADGIAGLELNVSCPNIKEGGNLFGTNLDLFKGVVSAVRKRTGRVLIVKLSPNVADAGVFARAAQDEGADAVSLINTLPALLIDIETRRPRLANVTGGLSGPAIRPYAQKLVWDAARAVSIPVIGMGGIASAPDAIEFMLAGASAVAVGTATFSDPHTVLDVIEGIESYMLRHGLRDLAGWRGGLITERA